MYLIYAGNTNLNALNNKWNATGYAADSKKVDYLVQDFSTRLLDMLDMIMSMILTQIRMP